MKSPQRWFRPSAYACVLGLVTGLAACGGRPPPTPVPAPAKRAATRPPAWVNHASPSTDQLCGVGVAGASYHRDSPYPRQLATERALRNLAGMLETQVQEAFFSRETLRGSSVDLARIVTVDEALIEKVEAAAETDFWLDEDGTGPFATSGFIYAHTCADTQKLATTLHIDQSLLATQSKHEDASPDRVPSWINRRGKQAGDKLCAIGFSLPTFHPEAMFEGVIEDVRGQLAHVLETLVASSYEERTSDRYQVLDVIHVATTEAVANGVVVTHYWYDEQGIGPFTKKRSTYGWGCVYPTRVLERTFEQTAAKAPEKKDVIRKVRERAQNAFDALENEENARAMK